MVRLLDAAALLLVTTAGVVERTRTKVSEVTTKGSQNKAEEPKPKKQETADEASSGDSTNQHVSKRGGACSQASNRGWRSANRSSSVPDRGNTTGISPALFEGDCRTCGRTGHISKDCRVRQACFNCGELDHHFRTCPE